MSNLNRWLKVSTEQHEEAAPVLVDDTQVEDIVDEINDSAIELNEAGEARAALEAYVDLVGQHRRTGNKVDGVLAKAIYIGLEKYNFNTDVMPSVESYGGLSVSVELLDKLKDGAKAVGNKIKEIYEYIVNLLKRMFGVINDKTEKLEEKQEEIKEALKTVEPIKGGDDNPKPVDPVKVKPDMVVVNEPKRLAAEPKEVPQRKEHKEYFVRVKKASLLFYAGYCQPYHSTIMRNCFDQMDDAMLAYFNDLPNALDELFPSGHSAAADAEKHLYKYMRRSKWSDLLQGEIGDGEFEHDYSGSGSGFDTGELQISTRNKDRPRNFIGSYLSVNFKTVPAPPKYDDPYLVSGPSQSMLESLIDLSTKVLLRTDDFNKIDFEKEMAPIKDSSEAVANARMLFINLNYARVLAEYLNYRAAVLDQFMDCIAAIVLRKESEAI